MERAEAGALCHDPAIDLIGVVVGRSGGGADRRHQQGRSVVGERADHAERRGLREGRDGAQPEVAEEGLAVDLEDGSGVDLQFQGRGVRWRSTGALDPERLSFAVEVAKRADQTRDHRVDGIELGLEHRPQSRAVQVGLDLDGLSQVEIQGEPVIAVDERARPLIGGEADPHFDRVTQRQIAIVDQAGRLVALVEQDRRGVEIESDQHVGVATVRDLHVGDQGGSRPQLAKVDSDRGGHRPDAATVAVHQGHSLDRGLEAGDRVSRAFGDAETQSSARSGGGGAAAGGEERGHAAGGRASTEHPRPLSTGT
jgi:hypothetical protein